MLNSGYILYSDFYDGALRSILLASDSFVCYATVVCFDYDDSTSLVDFLSFLELSCDACTLLSLLRERDLPLLVFSFPISF